MALCMQSRGRRFAIQRQLFLGFVFRREKSWSAVKKGLIPSRFSMILPGLGAIVNGIQPLYRGENQSNVFVVAFDG
jgi:hypothetical protein